MMIEMTTTTRPEPGYRRAGYADPDCRRYLGNTDEVGARARSGHGPADGWRDAGFDSPECERFEDGRGTA